MSFVPPSSPDAPPVDREAVADPALDHALAELAALERGFLLGVFAGGNLEPSGLADGLTGESGRRCGEAARLLERQPRVLRLRLMSRLAEEALAPVPAGLARVHPDIVSALWRRESPETRGWLAAAGVPQPAAAGEKPHGETPGGPPSRELVSELLRGVLAPIVPVPSPAAGAGPRRWALRLLALGAEALADELRGAGADLLGLSLRGADAAALDRAAAHVGAPWGERLLRAAADTAATGAPENEPAALAAERTEARKRVAATPPGWNPLATLEQLGARALGHRLAREDPDLAEAIAQRLPADLREALLGEALLAAAAGT